MICYHATHKSNLLSIQRHGILACHATGLREAVWMVPSAHIGWAVVHAAKRHAWKAEEMVVIAFTVRCGEIVKHPCGAYWTQRDIEPRYFLGISWCGTRYPVPHAEDPDKS